MKQTSLRFVKLKAELRSMGAEQKYKRALRRCNPTMSANEEEEPSLTDHLKQSIQENTNYLTQRKREQYSHNMPDFERGIDVEQLTIVDKAKPLKDSIRQMFYTAADDYETALRTPAPPIPGAEVKFVEHFEYFSRMILSGSP